MDYLAEFEGTYLEDSYLVGIVAEGQDLRLLMLFALTLEHAAYAAPLPDEAHCFRKGYILIEQPEFIEWHPGTPKLSCDAEGTLDLGSLELYRQGADLFRFHTEWFNTTVDARQVSLLLD